MSVTAKNKLFVFKRDGFRCKVCQTSENLTVDHIIPISKGGTDEPSNLQTMCRKHNYEKGNKMEFPWWKRIYKFRPFSKEDSYDLIERLRGEMATRELLVRRDFPSIIQSAIDKRFGVKKTTLQPSAQTEIEGELMRYLNAQLEIKTVGIKNDIDRIERDMKARHKHVMGLIELICRELEDMSQK